MVVLLWILDKLRPIIVLIGLIFLITGIFTGEYDASVWFWIIAGLSAIIGGIFGVKAWNEDIPPRWFWVKSPLELFDNKVGACFQWAFTFFLLPLCIYGIVAIFN